MSEKPSTSDRIFKAVISGNESDVKKLISNRLWLLFEVNNEDLTPYQVACMEDKLDIVKLIDEMGFNFIEIIDKEGNFPIHLAAKGKGSKVLDYLIRKEKKHAYDKNYVNYTPIHLSCMNGNFRALKALLYRNLFFIEKNEILSLRKLAENNKEITKFFDDYLLAEDESNGSPNTNINLSGTSVNKKNETPPDINSKGITINQSISPLQNLTSDKEKVSKGKHHKKNPNNLVPIRKRPSPLANKGASSSPIHNGNFITNTTNNENSITGRVASTRGCSEEKLSVKGKLIESSIINDNPERLSQVPRMSYIQKRFFGYPLNYAIKKKSHKCAKYIIDEHLLFVIKNYLKDTKLDNEIGEILEYMCNVTPPDLNNIRKILEYEEIAKYRSRLLILFCIHIPNQVQVFDQYNILDLTVKNIVDSEIEEDIRILFDTAIRRSVFDLLSALLKCYPEINRELLSSLCKNGNLESVKIITEHYKSCLIKNPELVQSFIDSAHDHSHIVTYLSRDFFKEFAPPINPKVFIEMLKNCDISGLDVAYSQDPQILTNTLTDGLTPLFFAIKIEKLDTVKYLISKGVDITKLEFIDSTKMSPRKYSNQFIENGKKSSPIQETINNELIKLAIKYIDEGNIEKVKMISDQFNRILYEKYDGYPTIFHYAVTKNNPKILDCFNCRATSFNKSPSPVFYAFKEGAYESGFHLFDKKYTIFFKEDNQIIGEDTQNKIIETIKSRNTDNIRRIFDSLK